MNKYTSIVLSFIILAVSISVVVAIEDIIDDSLPEVLFTSVTGFLGNDLTITSTITDDLGVTSAEAEIIPFSCASQETHSCDVTWCEEFDEDSFWDCPDFERTSERCADPESWCSENWDEEGFENFEDCVNSTLESECSPITYTDDDEDDSCIDYCNDNLGEGTWEACLNTCYDDECTFVETGAWESCGEDTEFDSECFDECLSENGENESAFCSTECEVSITVNDCVEDNLEYCTDNWNDKEYDNIQDCLDDLCYDNDPFSCDWVPGVDCGPVCEEVWDEEYICEDMTFTNDTCLDSCLETGDKEFCEVECEITSNSCETYCDLDGGEFEGDCISSCEDEYCDWEDVHFEVCEDLTSSCDGGRSGFDVECANDAAIFCEINAGDGEPTNADFIAAYTDDFEKTVICHNDHGSGEFKNLALGVGGATNHISKNTEPDHLGDHVGACTGDEGIDFEAEVVICHNDHGSGNFTSLVLGIGGANNHIAKNNETEHLGDHFGACTGEEGPALNNDTVICHNDHGTGDYVNLVLGPGGADTHVAKTEEPEHFGDHFGACTGEEEPAFVPDDFDKVLICHNDHGSGEYKNIALGIGGAVNHVSKTNEPDHLGDHFGACTGEEEILFNGQTVICHNDHGNGNFTSLILGIGGANNHIAKNNETEHLGDHFGACTGEEGPALNNDTVICHNDEGTGNFVHLSLDIDSAADHVAQADKPKHFGDHFGACTGEEEPAFVPDDFDKTVICHNDHGSGNFTNLVLGVGGAVNHVSKNNETEHLGDHFGACTGEEGPALNNDTVICHNDHGSGLYKNIALGIGGANNHVSKTNEPDHFGDHFGACTGEEVPAAIVDDFGNAAICHNDHGNSLYKNIALGTGGAVNHIAKTEELDHFGDHFGACTGEEEPAFVPDDFDKTVICHNDHGSGEYKNIALGIGGAKNHVSKTEEEDHLGDRFGPCSAFPLEFSEFEDSFSRETECVSSLFADFCVFEDWGVLGCVMDVEDYCESNWEDDWDSFDECVEDESRECYDTSCPDYSGDDDYDRRYDNERNKVNEVLTCTDACNAEADCAQEDRIYTDVPVELVELSLTSGTPLNGVWTGEIDDDVLLNGVHYEAFVTAMNGSGSENSEENRNDNTGSFNARPSYDITIGTAGGAFGNEESFLVDGSVTSSDGSSLPAGDIIVETELVPLVLSAYMRTLGPLTAGDHTLTATYTPNAACEETFSARTTVDITTARSSGSGGGGGGTYTPYFNRQNSGGGTGDHNQETEETDSSNNPVDSGTGDESGSGSESSSGSGSEGDTGPDNLLTGAVTGPGFFGNNWPWLAALGGLILLLLAGYRFAKP